MRTLLLLGEGGTVMNTITPDVVVAYSHCSRKAFLIFHAEDPGMPHEYVRLLEEKACRNRYEFEQRIKQEHPDVTTGNVANFLSGEDMLLRVQLKANDLVANCDVLKKVYCGQSYGRHRYEPMIIVGTHQIMQEQKLAVLFVGYVLGKLQNQLPEKGAIVGADGHVHKVDMKSANRILTPMIKALRQWTDSSSPPAVLLNKHCPTCQFRNACMEHAEKVDDLSLLDRVTPKIIQRYHKKGIFTVTQLSYVYKPRRQRKRRTKAQISFKVDLQALAIRTKKIYVQELPTLVRRDVELFLDFEGVPDQNLQYLIGILINNHGDRSYHFCNYTGS